MSLLYRAMQVGFNFYAVLDFELPQFLWMPVVHHDGLVVIRQTQPGQQRAGDASAAQKDDGIFGRGFMRGLSCETQAGAVRGFDQRRDIFLRVRGRR